MGVLKIQWRILFKEPNKISQVISASVDNKNVTLVDEQITNQ